MIEKVLKGKSTYWMWLAVLGTFIAIGAACYVRQYMFGLGLTGMSRDVSWGLYISQFTFLVGVAAGGLMLVLPYYVHDYKAFGRITILGEFLAISALIMCLMFIMADLGQPLRGLNVIFFPTPHSMLFWDMCVLWGYLILNCLCGWVILTAERKQVHPPKWIYIFVYIFDSLCRFNPYRHRHAVLWSAGAAFLVVGDHRSQVPGLGLCRRPLPDRSRLSGHA